MPHYKSDRSRGESTSIIYPSLLNSNKVGVCTFPVSFMIREKGRERERGRANISRPLFDDGEASHAKTSLSVSPPFNASRVFLSVCLSFFLLFSPQKAFSNAVTEFNNRILNMKYVGSHERRVSVNVNTENCPAEFFYIFPETRAICIGIA